MFSINPSATINANISQSEILKISIKIFKKNKKNYKLTKIIFNCKNCSKKIDKSREKKSQDLEKYLKTNKVCKNCGKIHNIPSAKIIKTYVKLQQKNSDILLELIEDKNNEKNCYLDRDDYICEKHYKILDRIAYNNIWKNTINFVFEKFVELNTNSRKNAPKHWKETSNR